MCKRNKGGKNGFLEPEGPKSRFSERAQKTVACKNTGFLQPGCDKTVGYAYAS